MNTKKLRESSHRSGSVTIQTKLVLSHRARISALLSAALLLPLSGTTYSEPSSRLALEPIIAYYRAVQGNFWFTESPCFYSSSDDYLTPLATVSGLLEECAAKLQGPDGPAGGFIDVRSGPFGLFATYKESYDRFYGDADDGTCGNPKVPEYCTDYTIAKGRKSCPVGFQLKWNDDSTALYCEGPGSVDPDAGGDCPASAGNPIEITTGIKTQPEVDYSGPDGLSFVRTYRSKTGRFESILTSAGKAPGAKSIPAPYYTDTISSDGTPEGRGIKFAGGQAGGTNVVTYGLMLVDSPEHHTNANGDWLVDGINGTRVNKNPAPSPDPNVWVKEFIDRNGNVVRYNALGKPVETWSAGDYANRLTYSYYSDKDDVTRPDIKGLIKEITSSAGRKLKFEYNFALSLSKMTDPAGGIYKYEYDVYNNLTKVTYPDGTTRQYVYNENLPDFPAGSQSPVAHHHALTGIIDENGNRYATYTYDRNGKGSSSYHYGSVNDNPNQIVDRHNFLHEDGKTTLTDPLGTEYVYRHKRINGTRRITDLSQPGGSGCGASASHNDYDDRGNVTRSVDFNGNITQYTYYTSIELQDLEESRTEAFDKTEARITRTEWNPDLRLPSRITEEYKDSQGVAIGDKNRVTVLEYVTDKADPAYGNLKSRSITADDGNGQPKGLYWSYSYYPKGNANAGRLMSATDPTGATTSFIYCDGGSQCFDRSGDLKKIIAPNGLITTFDSYDDYGRATQITDPNGVVSKLVYDRWGRPTSSTILDADNALPGSAGVGLKTTYTYYPTGQVKQITSPDGETIDFTYDTAYRLTDIKDKQGNNIHYTLDGAGNRIKEQVIGENGKVLQSRSKAVDSLGRVQLVKGAYTAYANTPPTASNVVVKGVNLVGKTLTGSYTYNDADGDKEDKTRTSFSWLRGEIPIRNATTKTYKVTGADEGSLLTFVVTPASVVAPTTGASVRSAAVPIIAPTAPTASDVRITINGLPVSGYARANQTLVGAYTYDDVNNDAEGATKFRWLRVDKDGISKVVGKARSYKVVAADKGNKLILEVTPVAKKKPSQGAAVQSDPVPISVAY